MKISPVFFSALGILALLTSTVARGQLMFDVQLNTSALAGHSAAPFYIDFQLNDGAGEGEGNNTAILSNFTFSGGGAVGSSMTFGGASGSLGSSVTLTDSSAFNEFIQAFTPGALLAFRLHLTTAVSGAVPDLFSFAILDSTLANLPTLSAGSDVFMSINLTGESSSVETFASNNARSPAAGGPPLNLPAPLVTPVPEPSTYGLIGAVVLVCAAAWRRRSRSPS